MKGDLSLWNSRLKTSNAQPEALLKKQKDHRHIVTVDRGSCQISSSRREGLGLSQGRGRPSGGDVPAYCPQDLHKSYLVFFLTFLAYMCTLR